MTRIDSIIGDYMAQSNSIIGIKLSSGEEVIGTFSEQSTTEILVLDKPVVLAHVRTQQGISATFVPVVHGAGDLETLNIRIAAVTILPYNVSSDVKKAYLQNTSSLDLSAIKL